LGWLDARCCWVILLCCGVLLSASTSLGFGWALVAGLQLRRSPSNLGQPGSANSVQPKHSPFSPLMCVFRCGWALGMLRTAAKTEPKTGPNMDYAQPVVLPSKSPTFPQRKSSRLLVLRGSAEQWVIMSASVASFLHTLSHLHKSRRDSNRCSFFAGAAGGFCIPRVQQ